MIKKYKEFDPERLIESCGGGISSCGISSCGGSSGSSGYSSCGGSGYSSCGGAAEDALPVRIRKRRNKKFDQLFDEKSCVNCGENIIEGAKFCHSCGEKL